MSTLEKSNLAWLNSVYGQNYLEAEKPHMDRALRQISGPRVLQIGDIFDDQALQALDFPQLIKVNRYLGAEDELATKVASDPAFLPFDADCLSTVILPHVLEGHELPHQVLREVHRVLMPEGHLIITGFSPSSIVSVQRYLTPRAAFKGNYYSAKRVRDWLQLLGFEVVANALYQYSPFVKNERVRNSLNFINVVGDSWLPMLGGGYMISAKKRDIGMRLVGKLPFKGIRRKRRKLSTASAATSKHHSTTKNNK